MARPTDKKNQRSRRPREQKEFDEKIVAISRVAKSTKGGNNISFNALTVIGDKKSRVGVAMGKAPDVLSAIKKGTKRAKKTLIKVPIQRSTIPFPIEMRYGSARVMLKPAPKGTGVIAGGPVRAVLEAAGISNIVGKILGSPNKKNNVYATHKALHEIARLVAVKGIEIKEEKVEKSTRELQAEKKRAEKKAKKDDKAATKKVTKVKKVVKKSTKITSDDLTKIEGVGPKIAEKLVEAKLATFKALAKASAEDLNKVLENAGKRFAMHDPSTWAQQAALAADEKWDELKKLQDELNGGKVEKKAEPKVKAKKETKADKK